MTNAFAARMLSRETDAAFVSRLLSEEGWNWRLEHSDDGKPLSEAKAAKHCLVITDAQASRMEALSSGFNAIKGAADKMIPQALKELNAYLKTVQAHILAAVCRRPSEPWYTGPRRGGPSRPMPTKRA